MSDQPHDPGSVPPGVAWNKAHLLRRRLSDLLAHADALEADVSKMLDRAETEPGESLNKVVQLRAQLADLDRILRAYAQDLGEDPKLPTSDLRTRLRTRADRRSAIPSGGYTGPERRKGFRRAG